MFFVNFHARYFIGFELCRMLKSNLKEGNHVYGYYMRQMKHMYDYKKWSHHISIINIYGDVVRNWKVIVGYIQNESNQFKAVQFYETFNTFLLPRWL